jgi:hypothetical protein
MSPLETLAGSGLTPEQIAEIREAAKYPIVFDEDCPELTDEQLAEFRPVNFATMEERDRAMREAWLARAGAGLGEPELVPAGK